MDEMPQNTPLIRTVDVSEERWNAFIAAVETESDEGFRAYVRYLTDARFLGADIAALRSAFTEEAVILVADGETFSHPDVPILCIDPEGISPPFRAAVKDLWVVENNLSIGNLLFEEIAEDQVVDGRLITD